MLNYYLLFFSIDLAAFLQKASVPEQNSNSLSSKTNANQPGQSSLISQQIVPPMQTNVAPRPQTYDFNQYAKEASESIKAAVGVSIAYLSIEVLCVSFLFKIIFQ